MIEYGSPNISSAKTGTLGEILAKKEQSFVQVLAHFIPTIRLTLLKKICLQGGVEETFSV